MVDSHAPIAVFDSGMGGISVLRELVCCMPNEDFLFFGDSLHAPYGTRPVQEVRELTMGIAEQLTARGAKALVVACNTATSAAIGDLRARWPDLPVVGLEPALKPAVLACPRGRVLVLATPLTLREEKFAALMDRCRGQASILSQPAPELVEFVERGLRDRAELAEYLHTLLTPYREEPVDGVVLGCTHFPFARTQIARALGYPVRFFDGGSGAARETCRLLERAGTRCTEQRTGTVALENSEDNEARRTVSWKLFRMED